MQEINRLVDGAVLGIDGLFLNDHLLLNAGGKQLIGVLLRMQLDQLGRIDLAEDRHFGLLARVGGVRVGFEI